MKQRILNYKFSPKDPRRLKYKSIMHTAVNLLPEQDLCLAGPHVAGVMPPIYDQGDEGSCTANAAVGHYEYLLLKFPHVFSPRSRQFFYTVERIKDGNLRSDAGSSLSTSAECALKYGFAAETLWPYVRANMFKKPPKPAYQDATGHTIGAFYEIHGTYEMQKCLSNGFPFVFGTIVPQQIMEDGFDGWLTKFGPNDVLVEDGYPAGHALMCVGYKKVNGKLWFKIRNSWGTDYAQKGYFWAPTEFMGNTDWVSDCFTFRLAHQPGM